MFRSKSNSHSKIVIPGITFQSTKLSTPRIPKKTEPTSTIHNKSYTYPNWTKSTANETSNNCLQFICFDRKLDRSPRVSFCPDKNCRQNRNPKVAWTRALTSKNHIKCNTCPNETKLVLKETSSNILQLSCWGRRPKTSSRAPNSSYKTSQRFWNFGQFQHP